MKRHWHLRILVSIFLWGAHTGTLHAQSGPPAKKTGDPAKQATDPDDLTPAEKMSLPAGISGVPAAPWNWTIVDADFGPLPSSMHVYRTQDSLDGRPSIAYYVSVPLKDRSLFFTSQVGYGKRLKPAEYYAQEQQP